MNYYSLHIKMVRTLKLPWFGWKIILWCQLIKRSQCYLFFCTCLQLNIISFSPGRKTCLVCQVKYFNGFDPTCNNAPNSCYLIWSSVLLSGVPQGSVLVLCFSQYVLILLGSLRSDMGLNIVCILVTHSCIYHYILTIS